MVKYDPSQRISARGALLHKYFNNMPRHSVAPKIISNEDEDSPK